MADRDRATVRIQPSLVAPVDTEVDARGDDLARERLVQLDDRHVLHLEIRAPERLARRGYRTEAHLVRTHPRRAGAHDTGDRLEAERPGPLGGRHDHRRGAVVDPGAVAGGDAPTVLECGLE